MFINWNNEKHSIGIDKIDNHHKELFLLINQLHELLEQDQYQDEAIRILKRLYAYTSYHFISEESLFKEYNYPGINEHMEIHDAFKEKIKEYLEGVRSRMNYPLDSLQDYLVEWVIKHIQGEDVKYAEFFKKNGVQLEMHFSISENKRDDVITEWNNRKLEMEIHDIDNQHRELIYILQQTNDLQHTSETRKRLYIPIIIKKLFYYSQYHFSYEEEHMSKNGYELIDEQKKLHKDFIDEIIKFAEEYKQERIFLTDEIILFLKDWTINHILTEDKKYKKYLEKIR